MSRDHQSARLAGPSVSMDQSGDPRELERKIEQATRLVWRVSDQTIVERLRAWIYVQPDQEAAGHGGQPEIKANPTHQEAKGYMGRAEVLCRR